MLTGTRNNAIRRTAPVQVRLTCKICPCVVLTAICSLSMPSVVIVKMGKITLAIGLLLGRLANILNNIYQLISG